MSERIEAPQALEQLATFRVAELLLGVDVRRVQEVMRALPMTRIPLAPPTVRGLINLRGQIVTGIDLRRRLGLADRAEGAASMNVVLWTQDGPVSFLVDEIGDVLDVRGAPLEPPPETLDGPAREVVRGVYPLKGRLLHLIDPDRSAEFG